MYRIQIKKTFVEIAYTILNTEEKPIYAKNLENYKIKCM